MLISLENQWSSPRNDISNFASYGKIVGNIGAPLVLCGVYLKCILYLIVRLRFKMWRCVLLSYKLFNAESAASICGI